MRELGGWLGSPGHVIWCTGAWATMVKTSWFQCQSCTGYPRAGSRGADTWGLIFKNDDSTIRPGSSAVKLSASGVVESWSRITETVFWKVCSTQQTPQKTKVKLKNLSGLPCFVVVIFFVSCHSALKVRSFVVCEILQDYRFDLNFTGEQSSSFALVDTNSSI